MNEHIEPKFRDASPSSLAVASRYRELAAEVEGAEPYLERTFHPCLYRLPDGSARLHVDLDDYFHSMRIALVLDTGGTVTEAVGEMLRRPYGTCPRALDSLGGLVGLNLHGPGVSAQARERIPRAEGCLHLGDMVAMAIRAFHISKGREAPYEGEEGRALFIRVLPSTRDSCVSYAVEHE